VRKTFFCPEAKIMQVIVNKQCNKVRNVQLKQAKRKNEKPRYQAIKKKPTSKLLLANEEIKKLKLKNYK
jgi:hypothetical protein